MCNSQHRVTLDTGIWQISTARSLISQIVRNEPVTACTRMEGNIFPMSLLAIIMVLMLTIIGAIFTATLFLSYLITRGNNNQGQAVPLLIHRHHRQSEEDFRRGGRGRRNWISKYDGSISNLGQRNQKCRISNQNNSRECQSSIQDSIDSHSDTWWHIHQYP